MLRCILLFLCGLLSASPALAQKSPPASGGPISDTGGWTITLKANAFAGPTFPGSAKTGFIAYPSGSIRRAGTAATWGAPDDSLSFALYSPNNFEFGVVGRYQGGRYTGSHKDLRGLKDVRWSIEPGVYVQTWIVPDSLRARFELKRGFLGHEGILGTLGIDAVQKYGNWTFSAGPRLNVADQSYMKSWFGISQQEAAWNGRLAAYRPSAGVKSYGATGAITYRWNSAWATSLSVQWERLTGPAGNSPIVRTIGKRDQITVGVTASYSFDWR